MRVTEFSVPAQVRPSVQSDSVHDALQRIRLALICGMPAPEVARMAADAMHQMADIGQGGAQ